MFDDIYQSTYILRYVFAVLSVVLIWLMSRRSVRALRYDMVYGVKPVPGAWLFWLDTRQSRFEMTAVPKAAGKSGRALPLYHTTCIGRSAACDIRLRSEMLSRRHAMIYFYDGEWYLKPVSRKYPVYLNGVFIIPATPLESGDIVQAGDQFFEFCDNLPDSEDYRPFNDSTDISSLKKENYGGVWLSWLLVNIYILLAGVLAVMLIPDSLEAVHDLVPVVMLAAVALINLYFVLLPWIFPGLDRYLLLLLLFLLAFGMVIQLRLSGILSNGVLAAAAALADGDLSAGENLGVFDLRIISGLRPQAIAIAAGLAILPFVIIITARTRLLEPLMLLCAFLTPAFLLTTLILGTGRQEHGASLWIMVGGMSLQLTEFAKITYLVVLAGFFKVRPSSRVQIVFAVWAAIVFLLIMLLPDLGMVMILLPTTLFAYIIMTSEYLKAFILTLSGVAVSGMAYLAFPHVKTRLAGWSSLWLEVNDGNRQIVYGLQAIGRGGLLGRGIGNGSSGGIPLASSDMVFAIICEEFGMIGGLFLLGMFIVLWLRAARITVIAQDGFTSALALAIGTMFFFEAVVVIAGVTGLIPLTGVTLPLIAEGGSSVLSKLILLGLLIGLSARREKGIQR